MPDGGESVRIGVYRLHSHPFVDVHETPAPQAQPVRRASRAFVGIRMQFPRKYGPEYGQKRSRKLGSVAAELLVERELTIA